MRLWRPASSFGPSAISSSCEGSDAGPDRRADGALVLVDAVRHDSPTLDVDGAVVRYRDRGEIGITDKLISNRARLGVRELEPKVEVDAVARRRRGELVHRFREHHAADHADDRNDDAGQRGTMERAAPDPGLDREAHTDGRGPFGAELESRRPGRRASGANAVRRVGPHDQHHHCRQQHEPDGTPHGEHERVGPQAGCRFERSSRAQREQRRDHVCEQHGDRATDDEERQVRDELGERAVGTRCAERAEDRTLVLRRSQTAPGEWDECDQTCESGDEREDEQPHGDRVGRMVGGDGVVARRCHVGTGHRRPGASARTRRDRVQRPARPRRHL